MNAQIQHLHAVYCELMPENKVELDMAGRRSHEWFDWLSFRRSEPFTEADLRLVIRWLQNEIKTNRRWPASLKFHNLIGMPDRFEEDLSCARSTERVRAKVKTQAVDPAKLSVLDVTGRVREVIEPQTKTAAQIFNENKLLKSLLQKEGL